jgi:hypothetical protein
VGGLGATLFFVFAGIAANDAPSTSAVSLMRSTLRARELRWSLDPDLAGVAAEAARAALASPDAVGGSLLEARLRRRGLGDPSVLPFAIFGRDAEGPGGAAAARQLGRIVDSVAERPGVSHAAAGWAHGSQGWALVALFSRRPVDWLRPRRQGAAVRFAAAGGRVPERLEVLSFGPCVDPRACRRPVVRRWARRGPEGLAFELARPPGAGRWVVEALDPARPADPVVGWWFFDQGPIAPFRPVGPPERWLVDLRAASRIGPMAVDLELTAAAEHRAADVCREGRALHGTGAHDGPEVRARGAGYTGGVAENVAVASSAHRAFRNLLWSPSHRAQMTDPRATRIGTASVTRAHRTCLVQIFGYAE